MKVIGLDKDIAMKGNLKHICQFFTGIHPFFQTKCGYSKYFARWVRPSEEVCARNSIDSLDEFRCLYRHLSWRRRRRKAIREFRYFFLLDYTQGKRRSQDCIRTTCHPFLSKRNIFLSILATMDNNHYFGLYLIRIKHGLVLFSLSLTAVQSLVYLLFAIFSDKVTMVWLSLA